MERGGGGGGSMLPQGEPTSLPIPGQSTNCGYWGDMRTKFEQIKVSLTAIILVKTI